MCGGYTRATLFPGLPHPSTVLFVSIGKWLCKILDIRKVINNYSVANVANGSSSSREELNFLKTPRLPVCSATEGQKVK